MDSQTGIDLDKDSPKQATKQELNSWRRGFTPQAEIWNGRMAMFGLAVGLTSLVVIHKLVN
tara:strand:- start:1150 stop:1332 length:183 start_codon:yes stop_codon:yes gene_type:complete